MEKLALRKRTQPRLELLKNRLGDLLVHLRIGKQPYTRYSDRTDRWSRHLIERGRKIIELGVMPTWTPRLKRTLKRHLGKRLHR